MRCCGWKEFQTSAGKARTVVCGNHYLATRSKSAGLACHEVGQNCVGDGEGWLAHGPHEV